MAPKGPRFPTQNCFLTDRSDVLYLRLTGRVASDTAFDCTPRGSPSSGPSRLYLHGGLLTTFDEPASTHSLNYDRRGDYVATYDLPEREGRGLGLHDGHRLLFPRMVHLI